MTPAESIRLHNIAQREAAAQLEIIQALKPLNHDSQRLVLNAMVHLIEADWLMHGVLAIVRESLEQSSPDGERAAKP